MTLLRSLPVMLESFRLGVSQMKQRRQQESDAAHDVARVDRDLPFSFVAGGVCVVLVVLVFAPEHREHRRYRQGPLVGSSARMRRYFPEACGLGFGGARLKPSSPSGSSCVSAGVGS